MLSSVLRSKRAAQMNVLIMRAFVRLRRMLGENKELSINLSSWKSTSIRMIPKFCNFSAPFET